MKSSELRNLFIEKSSWMFDLVSEATVVFVKRVAPEYNSLEKYQELMSDPKAGNILLTKRMLDLSEDDIADLLIETMAVIAKYLPLVPAQTFELVKAKLGMGDLSELTREQMAEEFVSEDFQDYLRRTTEGIKPAVEAIANQLLEQLYPEDTVDTGANPFLPANPFNPTFVH